MRRVLYVVTVLALLSGIWVNHSRAAQGIFLLQCVMGLGILHFSGPRDGIMQRKWPVLIGAAVVALGAILMLTMLFGLDRTLDKWRSFADGGFKNDGRWAAFRTCAQWFGDVPALGYGAGTFAAVFVVKTTGMTDAPRGYWQFAHNDYLQTFLEWGWIGLLLWLAVGSVVLRRSAKAMRGQDDGDEAETQRVLAVAVFIALISVVVHAVFDFPLQIFAIQLYTATLAGVGYSLAQGSREQSTSEAGRQRRRRHSERHARPHAGAP